MAEVKGIHRATSRVLDVLELIASNNNGYTFTEICEKTASPKGSMFPIIHTLEDRNYIFLDSSSRYKIDRAAFLVGNSYLEHLNFMGEVEIILRNIVNICSETCHFAIQNDQDVLYLKKIDSPEPIRMISNVGKRMPAYGTSLGKALMIDYSLNDLKKLYPNGLNPLTENTITDINQLHEQLLKARTEGFTYEIEESNQYIRCIAIPIRQKSQIVAAVSVAVPTFRFNEEKSVLIKTLLFDAKNKIENIIEIANPDLRSLI